jgi:hypothetical protein
MLNNLRNPLPIEPTVQCCLCGLEISNELPLSIALGLPNGASQGMFAHGACFAAILHPSVPFLTPAEYLQED